MPHLNNTQYKEVIRRTNLSKLPYYLNKLEKKIYNLTKLQMSGDSNILNRLRQRRNAIRCVLLEKLQEWKENPKSHPEITYSEVLQIEERKNLKENYEQSDE